MATVHRAVERGIDGFERVVALKRLLPHLAEDEGFVRAFVREAKLASMLQHGNIVQLYELGRVGTSYFISMEYIPGRDLRAILRLTRSVCGPPPIEVVLALMSQLLDALDYAHSQCDAEGKPLGLVHRDISPSNLIISYSGQLKVIDFGIAKATLGYLMTHTHRIKGKLSYMAPEVLAGRVLDGRSDLFSASVIAHELLTATPLFAAKDDFLIIDRLQNMQPPPPSARNPSCPNVLDEIVLRGLAKDPAQRWRSAAEMRAAIAEVASDQRRLATNRDICRWMEEAFHTPVSTTSRLRLPLTQPSSGPMSDPRRSMQSEPDDEIMDIVWGASGPRSAPVVLPDVPDVSSLAPPSSMLADADARTTIADSSPLNSTPVGRNTLTGGTGSASLPMWTHSDVRPLTNPFGVSPGHTTQPPQGMLEEAMWAARRAEALAMAAMAKHRPRSILPLFLASVVVAAAGGGIAWFLSSRGGNHASRQVAASQDTGAAVDGAGAQALPAAAAAPAPATPVPNPGAPVPNVMAPGAAAANVTAPASAPASIVAPAAVVPVGREPRAGTAQAVPNQGNAGRTGAAGGQAADAATRQPKVVARRDGGTDGVVRDRASEDNRDVVAAVGGERRVDERDDRATRTGSDAEESAGVARPPAAISKPTREPDSERDRLEPLPVPVQPPATGPSETVTATPRSSRGPIIVPASRVHRESGSVRPIRFPPEEQPPPQIVAKLCIDERGSVTSVAVLSQVSTKIRRALEHALSQWRYRPVVEGGASVAACFATAFPVQVE